MKTNKTPINYITVSSLKFWEKFNINNFQKKSRKEHSSTFNEICDNSQNTVDNCYNKFNIISGMNEEVSKNEINKIRNIQLNNIALDRFKLRLPLSKNIKTKSKKIINKSKSLNNVILSVNKDLTKNNFYDKTINNNTTKNFTNKIDGFKSTINTTHFKSSCNSFLTGFNKIFKKHNYDYMDNNDNIDNKKKVLHFERILAKAKADKIKTIYTLRKVKSYYNYAKDMGLIIKNKINEEFCNNKDNINDNKQLKKDKSIIESLDIKNKKFDKLRPIKNKNTDQVFLMKDSTLNIINFVDSIYKVNDGMFSKKRNPLDDYPKYREQCDLEDHVVQTNYKSPNNYIQSNTHKLRKIIYNSNEKMKFLMKKFNLIVK